MSKVVNELRIKKYVVLVLDEMPNKTYSSFLIQGKQYQPSPIYDAKNCIAIESEKSFIGKTVEFI